MVIRHHYRARGGFQFVLTAALAIAGSVILVPGSARAASYEGERILTLDDIVPVPTPAVPPSVAAENSEDASPRDSTVDAVRDGEPAGGESDPDDGVSTDSDALDDQDDEALVDEESAGADSESGNGSASPDAASLSGDLSEDVVSSAPMPEVVTVPSPESFDAPVTSGDVIYDPTIYIRDENGNLVPMPGQSSGIGVASGSDAYYYGDAVIVPEPSDVYYQGSRVPPIGPTYYYDASPMYYYGPYGPYGMWGPSVGWGFWSRPDYHRPPSRPRPPAARPPGRPPGMGRPPSGRPPGARPPGVRPPGGRPPGGRPPGVRPPGGRPPGGRPPGGRPPGVRPGGRPGGRPSGGRPGGGRPSGGTRPPRPR